jgi:hypothetical protein
VSDLTPEDMASYFERQALRDRGASWAELKQNRLAIVRR